MKEGLRATIVALAILGVLSPVAYVGGEGIWYAATETSYFPHGSTYRRVYAPLDAVSDHVPALYDARQTLANGWLRATGQEPRAIVNPMAIYLCH